MAKIKLLEKSWYACSKRCESKSNAGFNVDTNEGYFLYPDKDPKEMANMKKSELAQYIMKEVVELVANKHP